MDSLAALDKVIAGMRTIIPEAEYFALTLTSPAPGTITWGAYTHWVGWADEKRHHELREASIVRAERVSKTWEDSGESYLVVNNFQQLVVFLSVGGNALIEEDTAKKHLPDVIAPDPCVRSGQLGFRSLHGIPKSEFNRAPTRKQRMRIFKRDNYRCRICGRRTADYVDVELHVHHIRPWAKGGLTEDSNLITLCSTCHGGLDPHEDYALYSLLEPSSWTEASEVSLASFIRDVRRYRETVLEQEHLTSSPSQKLQRKQD